MWYIHPSCFHGLVILNDVNFRFESTILEAQHKTLNAHFNKQVQKAGNIWKYMHTKTIDSFYESGSREKIRVTKYATGSKIPPGKTADSVELLTKARIADLQIHMPRTPFDIRVSINLEQSLPESTLQNARKSSERDRYKDRLSYTFSGNNPNSEIMRFDLTCVTQDQTASHPQYECEIELLDLNNGIIEDRLPSTVKSLLSAIRHTARITK